jgi:hypothetical protein
MRRLHRHVGFVPNPEVTTDNAAGRFAASARDQPTGRRRLLRINLEVMPFFRRTFFGLPTALCELVWIIYMALDPDAMPTPQWGLQDDSGRIVVLDHKDRHRQVKSSHRRRRARPASESRPRFDYRRYRAPP